MKELLFTLKKESSLSGGNLMTIFGRGFSENTSASVTHQFASSDQCQSGECAVKFISSKEIRLGIPPLRGVKGEEKVRGLIRLRNENFEFEPVEFSYENRRTARVNSILTQYVGKVQKEDQLTIRGENFDESCDSQDQISNFSKLEINY